MEKELLSWIQNKKDVLDKVIADAAEDFRLKNQSQNFIYDCSETSRELWYLSMGEDLCYDRPTIAFTYSLWYHGKRVNTFLRYYFNLILQSLNEERIEIVDLGAGTGAVQWAVGIVYSGLRELNIKVPQIRIVNIDSSPFMLHYNQCYLWKFFVNKFEYCKEIFADYEVVSWINAEQNKNTNVWLSASYLFDHSENSKEITLEFEKLVKDKNPSKLLLLSAKPKLHLVDVVANNIASKGYDLPPSINDSYRQVFSGNLKYVNEYRSKLQSENNYGFSGPSSWNIDSLYGKVLTKRQG
nr:DNA helicase UvrD [Nitrosopumilus sp.]